MMTTHPAPAPAAPSRSAAPVAPAPSAPSSLAATPAAEANAALPAGAAPARPPVRRPEILAPAGSWDCARAAVENGADAIYFGIDRFNARLRAHNFGLEELPALMAFLHGRGVRGYLTFNTLVFADELAAAEETLRAVIAAGVDAAIVQDVGVCRLIRQLSPDFPIHASTQMTITSDAGVEFARELGAHLCVLARECSVAEIAKLRAKVAAEVELPLEVFVHGALCVAYSGQCLTSESLGGRSANRGECAQACRMPYELVRDGETVSLGDRRYLLSPQDLAGLEVIGDLIHAGVASFKIEGRLKTPEYVANVTRVYRRAVDRWMELLNAPAEPAPEARAALAGDLARSHRYDLEMAFSRGLYTGWLNGIQNQELAHARFGTKRGAFLGVVEQVVPGEGVWLRAEGPAKPGDGVVFDAGRPDEGEEGGRLFAVETDRAGRTFLGFGRMATLRWGRVAPGQRVWKTSDPELEKRLRATYTAAQPQFRRPLHFRVHGHAGAPLTVEAWDGLGHRAREASAPPLAEASARPLDAETLRAQLGRLGGTAYELGTLENLLEGAVILPVSELNRLRRELVARMDALRAEPPRWTLREAPAHLAVVAEAPPAPSAAEAPELIPVIRLPGQLDSLLADPAVRTIYAEFEDPKKYRAAVAQVRAAGGGRELWVAPPRIFKMGEDWIVQQVRSCGAHGYLARAHEHLRAFAGDRRRGDFSLNVANPLAAAHYRERYGLERLTASYDLNIAQLSALLRGAPAGWFEVTLHQHMPMFHMEHCVFCAFLSTGKDYRDCGRPCEKHDVRLRDRVGAEHRLKADAGCRNTVFNARAQTGAEYARHLLDLGVRHFRIEFLDEDAPTIARTLDRYRALLAGQISGADLWRELRLANQLGVTRGTLG